MAVQRLHQHFKYDSAYFSNWIQRFNFDSDSWYVWKAVVINLCSLCTLFPCWKPESLCWFQTTCSYGRLQSNGNIASSYMSLNEASLDTCMYYKHSMTAVTAAHVNARLRCFLYHVLLAGLFIIILMNVPGGFASVVYELGPNLIWLIWTDLFWVLMVLPFKETKCILESDFKAYIDLLCHFTAEKD